MTQLESSIVSTSALTITNELGGYDKSSWIFTAYLLTYGGKTGLWFRTATEHRSPRASGMLIIWAKLSDIFGRKPLLVTAVFIFIAFSGACGASQMLIQLYVSFQAA
jgi:MFS family permease